MEISCPYCDTKNDTSREYCICCGCGLPQVKKNVVQSNQTSQHNSNNAKDSVAFKPVEITNESTQKKSSKYIAPPSAFAEGLPEWDIVPPQIMLRRR